MTIVTTATTGQGGKTTVDRVVFAHPDLPADVDKLEELECDA